MGFWKIGCFANSGIIKVKKACQSRFVTASLEVSVGYTINQRLLIIVRITQVYPSCHCLNEGCRDYLLIFILNILNTYLFVNIFLLPNMYSPLPTINTIPITDWGARMSFQKI